MPARVRALADELPGFAQTVLRVMGASHGTDPGNLLVSALPDRAHANCADSAVWSMFARVVELSRSYRDWPGRGADRALPRGGGCVKLPP